MRKSDELTDPDSCMSKALPDEITFVLLARDKAAPGTVRDWIGRRIAEGLNWADDAQMAEAEQCARGMEAQRQEIRAMLGKPPEAGPAPMAEVVLTHGRHFLMVRGIYVAMEGDTLRDGINIGPTSLFWDLTSLEQAARIINEGRRDAEYQPQP